MQVQNVARVALVGNPNCGKSSLFNMLTRLHQKVGNFPGVTVEKRVGRCKLSEQASVSILDLPGTYSFYPRREDEWVVYRTLMQEETRPDAILMVLDATNLKRNLLLATQVMELRIPLILVLTMMDIAKRKRIKIDVAELERRVGAPVVVMHGRSTRGLAALKKVIVQTLAQQAVWKRKALPFLAPTSYEKPILQAMRERFPEVPAIYKLLHYAMFPDVHLDTDAAAHVKEMVRVHHFNRTAWQAEEITQRYRAITQILQDVVYEGTPFARRWLTDRLDSVLLHRYWGYPILLGVFFLIFQCIFWVAHYPMDWIEAAFAQLEQACISLLPNYIGTPAISNVFVGKLLFSGITSTLVFVPQIMILTAILTCLDDVGYMARVSFLSDSLMRKFGLNGKSLVPLISGMACAVPAVLAARNIENKRERWLTIFTIPFITCSARMPIFIMLTTMIVPEIYYFHIISLQGLVIVGLYMSGFFLSFFFSFLFKFFLKTKEKSIFILELPLYKAPHYRNILYDVWLKTKLFVVGAGKIIVGISVLLTILFSFVPSRDSERILADFHAKVQRDSVHAAQYEIQKDAALLQHSYATQIGKWAEPFMQPLGYNWQIGVAVLASFAAREVFISTLATVYSFEESSLEDRGFVRTRLARVTNERGEKVFTLATSLSLLVFYVLAMQCMSTLAMVRRETGSWLFAAGQFCFMGGLAWVCAFGVYHLFM